MGALACTQRRGAADALCGVFLAATAASASGQLAFGTDRL
jgi:hypothetical protein